MSRTILGYADRFSVAPGERIELKASCLGHAHYHLEIVRLVGGGVTPGGPGFREEVVPTGIAGNYPGRRQDIAAGSYALVPDSSALHGLASFSVAAMIWPTTPDRGPQILLDRRSKSGGFALAIDAGGGLALILEDGAGGHAEISTGRRMLEREWYFVGASFDCDRNRVLLAQEPQKAYARDDSHALRELIAGVRPGEAAAPLTMAAALDFDPAGARAFGHFNGKLDSPRLYSRALPAAQLRLTIVQPAAPAYAADLVGAWDFARDMSSDRIHDRSPNGLHGRLVNLPTRAMKGWNWDASELDWRRAPEQYGAIHFHDDDLYDAGWQTDATFEVPAHLRSGIYAARLQDGEEVERIPFFILPPRGTATADTLFLIPTASYMAYANERLGYDSDLAEVASGHVPALGR
jgi:N,N-dimethylformamidase